ncbi:MAG: hypothetical protein DRN71_04845, partial [Candidatus Nanohalarchaeota archaeon]
KIDLVFDNLRVSIFCMLPFVILYEYSMARHYQNSIFNPLHKNYTNEHLKQSVLDQLELLEQLFRDTQLTDEMPQFLDNYLYQHFHRGRGGHTFRGLYFYRLDVDADLHFSKKKHLDFYFNNLTKYRHGIYKTRYRADDSSLMFVSRDRKVGHLRIYKGREKGEALFHEHMMRLKRKYTLRSSKGLLFPESEESFNCEVVDDKLIDNTPPEEKALKSSIIQTMDSELHEVFRNEFDREASVLKESYLKERPYDKNRLRFESNLFKDAINNSSGDRKTIDYNKLECCPACRDKDGFVDPEKVIHCPKCSTFVTTKKGLRAVTYVLENFEPETHIKNTISTYFESCTVPLGLVGHELIEFLGKGSYGENSNVSYARFLSAFRYALGSSQLIPNLCKDLSMSDTAVRKALRACQEHNFILKDKPTDRWEKSYLNLHILDLFVLMDKSVKQVPLTIFQSINTSNVRVITSALGALGSRSNSYTNTCTPTEYSSGSSGEFNLHELDEVIDLCLDTPKPAWAET